MNDNLARTIETCPNNTAPVQAGKKCAGIARMSMTKRDVETSIPERFQRVAQEFPDQVAVQALGQSVRYISLNEASNRLARAILSLRPQRQEPVALLAEHDVSTIVGLLAVLKAGHIYVPLDPRNPTARLDQSLNDSQARLLVTNQNNLPLANELAARSRSSEALEIVNADDVDPRFSGDDLPLHGSAGTLASIFYTSGSTRQPIGVSWNHGSALRHAFQYTDCHDINTADRVALVLSCGFAASLPDVLCALLNGATLYPYDVKKRGLAELARWLRREEITIFHPPVTLLRHLIDTLDPTEHFPSLRLVMLGGQSVYIRDVDRLRRHVGPDCIIVNQLVSTEANLISRFIIGPTTRITGNNVPVGSVVAEKDVVLLGEDGAPVDRGQVGQIAVRSRHLFPGYWRRPDLDRQAFRSDSRGNGWRTYLTGDLGRVSEDGFLEYLGRNDRRVKIRGHRIDMAEVEAALHDLEDVREAAVVARDGPDEARLIAYVVPSIQPPPTTTRLRDALAHRLPDFMLPSLFAIIERLPATANGKVDLRALPEPDRGRSQRTCGYEAPRDLHESQLADIWEKILEVQPIGVNDDFFELGGDSLMAMRLLAEIAKTTGEELPVGALVEAPTIGRLADVLRQPIPPATSSSLLPLQPLGTQRPLFCVPPAARTVMVYADLARHLGSDQPVYGLQPQGLDGKSYPHTSVETMAAHYVKAIHRLDPEGPYCLVGMCFGSYVALEMAQQLTAAGRQVALLALLDPMEPPTGEPHVLSYNRSWQHYRDRFVYNWKRRDLGRKIRYTLWRIYVRLMGRLFDSPLGRRIQRVKDAHLRAKMSYVPKIYSGKITLFWSSDTDAVPDYRMDWARLTTSEFATHEIPGEHRRDGSTFIREPHVEVLAQELRACLRQAQMAATNTDHDYAWS